MRWFFTLISASTLLCGVERGWTSLELAKAYFSHSEIQRGWAWELLGQFPLKGDEHILDFGCGDGKISSEISRLVSSGSVSGIDLSKDMIYLANIHFPSTSYPNLTFKQVDSDTFAETLDRYDAITSFSVFHFVAQPVEILRQLKSHLNPNGKLLLTIPFPPSSVMRQAADEYFPKYALSPPWHHPGYSSKLSMRTLEGCKQKLAEAGYEILSLQLVETPSIFHDQDDFTDWLIGTASANWGIPFELSRPFFTDVVNRMLELDPTLINEEGWITLPQQRIHVIATPLN